MSDKMTIDTLLANNRAWSTSVNQDDPQRLPTLAKSQHPHFFWIGCSDSRVPANTITGSAPGELFVHRNIANLVIPTDLSLLSALTYAVEHLGVQEIILCGHYGCGGIKAAMGQASYGVIDLWIKAIKDLAHHHQTELQRLDNDTDRFDRLCELNVIHQVHNLAQTKVVQSRWQQGEPLKIHGLIYHLETGQLKDLNTTLTASDQVDADYRFERD